MDELVPPLSVSAGTNEPQISPAIWLLAQLSKLPHPGRLHSSRLASWPEHSTPLTCRGHDQTHASVITGGAPGTSVPYGRSSAAMHPSLWLTQMYGWSAGCEPKPSDVGTARPGMPSCRHATAASRYPKVAEQTPPQ